MMSGDAPTPVVDVSSAARTTADSGMRRTATTAAPSPTATAGVVSNPGSWAAMRPAASQLSARSGGWATCEGCGHSTLLDATAMHEIRRVIMDTAGFDAGFGHFPIVGRCAACLSVPVG